MAELLGRRAKNGDPIAILFLLELQVNYGEIEWVADCECGIDRRRVAYLVGCRGFGDLFVLPVVLHLRLCSNTGPHSTTASNQEPQNSNFLALQY